MTVAMKTPALAVPLLSWLLACSAPNRPEPAPASTVAIAPAPAPSASAASLTGVRADYVLDETGSAVTFLGSKVTGKHEGRFEHFRGSVQLLDGDITKGTVRVTVDVASVATDVDKLSAHLRSADFLDAERFPEATFASTRVQRQGDGYLVSGDLTLRGVTRSIAFPAIIEASRAEVKVSAALVISRSEFGITYPGKANDLIKDEVTIRLAVKARR